MNVVTVLVSPTSTSLSLVRTLNTAGTVPATSSVAVAKSSFATGASLLPWTLTVRLETDEPFGLTPSLTV